MYTHTQPSKRAIFTAYHRARKARHEDGTPMFERGRLNRALGLAQAKRKAWEGDVLVTRTPRKVKGGTAEVIHHTGRYGCDCEDCQYRRTDCHHIIARYMLMRAELLDQAWATENVSQAA